MVSLAQDAEGNRLTRTRVSDSYITAYEWDHRNRLVSVTEVDDMETVLAVTEHDYDAFNQWIRRTVDADGPGSGDPASTIFAHHDGQIVYQFDGDTAADLTNRYLWNPAAVDHLLVDEVVANLSTAGDLQFPLGDHLGTVRDIAEYDAGTDTTTIANHIRYNSFGAVISETNSTIDLFFGFTSRPFDDSTSLQNNLHRWYDAALGQWLSEDPIGFAAEDANVRRYVANRTNAALDPSGLVTIEYKKSPGFDGATFSYALKFVNKSTESRVTRDRFLSTRIDTSVYGPQGILIGKFNDFVYDFGGNAPFGSGFVEEDLRAEAIGNKKRITEELSGQHVCRVVAEVHRTSWLQDTPFQVRVDGKFEDYDESKHFRGEQLKDLNSAVLVNDVWITVPTTHAGQLKGYEGAIGFLPKTKLSEMWSAEEVIDVDYDKKTWRATIKFSANTKDVELKNVDYDSGVRAIP